MLLAETAVAAEMQRQALDEGLVRKAMAMRVKYRVSGNIIPIPFVEWLFTQITAEACTRSQTLF